MNIYEKLAEARLKLKKSGIKMSGKNPYANYEYFDLIDFMPKITEIEKDIGIISIVNFTTDGATLTVVNSEKPEEQITFTSPMSTAELKGCHAVQNLGAVETYIRRYLYIIAYEIVEVDALNLTQGKPEVKPNTPTARPQVKPTTANEAPTSLTYDEATHIVCQGGKYKGKTLLEIFETDRSYIEWMTGNASTPARIQTAIRLIKEAEVKARAVETAEKAKSDVQIMESAVISD